MRRRHGDLLDVSPRIDPLRLVPHIAEHPNGGAYNFRGRVHPVEMKMDVAEITAHETKIFESPDIVPGEQYAGVSSKFHADSARRIDRLEIMQNAQFDYMKARSSNPGIIDGIQSHGNRLFIGASQFLGGVVEGIGGVGNTFFTLMDNLSQILAIMSITVVVVGSIVVLKKVGAVGLMNSAVKSGMKKL